MARPILIKFSGILQINLARNPMKFGSDRITYIFRYFGIKQWILLMGASIHSSSFKRFDRFDIFFCVRTELF